MLDSVEHTPTESATPQINFIMKQIIFKDRIENRKIKLAAKILIEDGILIHPAENLYGFGAIISAQKSIAKISAIKKRKSKKSYIVLIGNLSQLDLLVNKISEVEKKLIDKFWPGALTIIFPAKKKFWKSPICQNKTIAIRFVGNEITQKIINETRIPIISTSVNISQKDEFYEVNKIIKKFENRVDGIAIDKIHKFRNLSSTIVKVVDKKIMILREGAIKKIKIFG